MHRFELDFFGGLFSLLFRLGFGFDMVGNNGPISSQAGQNGPLNSSAGQNGSIG